MKILKIEDEAHKIAKNKAKALGMTLQGYIKKLVNEDNKA